MKNMINTYLFKKLFFLFFIINTINVFAGVNENNTDDNIKLGFYIDDIYNIDYMNSSYEIIFYLWANSNNKLYPINLIDIDRATELQEIFIENDSTKEKKFNSLIKYKAKILNKMDISKYPFDKLNLNLYVELLGHYKGQKNITIDLKNTLVKPKFIDKWNVEKTNFKIGATKWSSNFGDISHRTNAQLDTVLYLDLDF